MKSKTSYALKMAHYLQSHAAEQQPLFNKAKPQTWKERVRLAWYFVKFNEALKDGLVTFSFWKKDGTIREAKGTKCMILIPKEDQPKALTPESVAPVQTIAFYDIDKKAWRSFCITHFIGFVSIYRLEEDSL